MLTILVIYQCGLKRDIDLFEAGDATEVGEKGITLRCVRLWIASFNVCVDSSEAVDRRLA